MSDWIQPLCNKILISYLYLHIYLLYLSNNSYVHYFLLFKGDDDDDNDEEDDGTYNCPLFQNSDREGDENFIIDFDLPTDRSASYWILTGTAMLCQRPLET